MASLLQIKVTERLADELGREPTQAEIENGMVAPWTLAYLHNELNVGQSIFSIDNTQNIQDSIDIIEDAGGGTLYLKGGTYNQSSDISIPSNILVQGVGSGGTIIDFGNSAHSINIIGTSGAHLTSPSLIGVTIQNTSSYGVRIDYVDNFLGKDIEVNNADIGLYATNITVMNLDTLISDSCGTAVKIEDSTGLTVNNLAIEGTTSGGACVFNNIQSMTFINSSIGSGIGNGITLDSCYDITVDSYSVIEVTGIGISLIDSSVIACSSGAIVDCTGDGIKLDGTSSCQILTTNFTDNGGYGVNILDATCENNMFAINDFSGNSSGAMDDNGTGTLVRSNIGLADN